MNRRSFLSTLVAVVVAPLVVSAPPVSSTTLVTTLANDYWTQGLKLVDSHERIAVRFIKEYDIETDRSPARMDVLYGWRTIAPDLACRIVN